MSHHYITGGLAIAFLLVVSCEDYTAGHIGRAADTQPKPDTTMQVHKAPTNATPTSLQILAPQTK